MKKAIPRKILLSLAVVILATLVAAPMVLASPATATRDLPTTVAPGAVFQVDLEVSDYGSGGEVTETIPAGFTYVAVSHPADINVTWDPVTGELKRTHYTYHQSPAYLEPRTFIIPKGVTREKLNIPVFYDFEKGRSLRIRVIADFPGSHFPGPVESDVKTIVVE